MALYFECRISKNALLHIVFRRFCPLSILSCFNPIIPEHLFSGMERGLPLGHNSRLAHVRNFKFGMESPSNRGYVLYIDYLMQKVLNFEKIVNIYLTLKSFKQKIDF